MYMPKKRTIESYLEEFNITEEYLRNSYIVKKLSLPDIKQEKGIGFSACAKLLRHFDIPVRNIREAKALPLAINKSKTSCQLKYGVDNPSQSLNIKNKKKETFLKNYGVDNVWKSEKFKAEINDIMLQKYGVLRKTDGKKISIKLLNKTAIEKQHTLDKRTATYVEKYGVENCQLLSEYKNANKVRMQKYWANLNDEQKQDLSLAFKNAWTPIKKEEKRKSNIAYWNTLSDAEKQFRLERLHSGVKSTSSLEQRISQIFNDWKSIDSHFNYIPHFYINSKNYDFLINNNIILEVQGDYWHGNPIKYKPTDIIVGPYKTITVAEVWDKDEKKKQLAIDKGYKIVYIWENEMRKLSDFNLEQLLVEKLQK